MPKLTRIFAASGFGGIVTAALLLERRRARRMRAAEAAHAARNQPMRTLTATPPSSGGDDDGDDDARAPLLSPTMFAASHFGLLVLLSAMVGGGLLLRGIRRYPPETTWHVHGGDAQRGRAVLEARGCGGCHMIPGIRSATGRAGPSLEYFSERMYIGGQLPNTPENLIAWLQDPQRYAPGTAMPNLLIDEAAARDMAAYLYRGD